MYASSSSATAPQRRAGGAPCGRGRASSLSHPSAPLALPRLQLLAAPQAWRARWGRPSAHPTCRAARQERGAAASSGDAPSTSQRAAEGQLRALEALPVQEARIETLAAWVGAAVAFGVGILYVQGPEKAQEYFAGYLLEQSLSIDNLFVFVLVFNFFKTPPAYQNKVLTYGIATAAFLRLAMIGVGVELIDNFTPLLAVFAGILVFSSDSSTTASVSSSGVASFAPSCTVKKRSPS